MFHKALNNKNIVKTTMDLLEYNLQDDLHHKRVGEIVL